MFLQRSVCQISKMQAPPLSTIFMLAIYFCVIFRFTSGQPITPPLPPPNSCAMLTAADLGETDALSTIISSAILEGIPVRISFVCFSAGFLRDTYSSASALVMFQLFPINSTQQFDFLCDSGDTWMPAEGFPEDNPTADFNTSQVTNCSQCSSGGSLSPGYDQDTHCSRKFNCCIQCRLTS